MSIKKTYPKGLTIIELLVVVLILVFIVTLGLVAFRNSRQKARDAVRVSDIRQIVNAFELFRSKYNYYPGADPQNGAPNAACGAVTCDCNGPAGAASGVIGNNQSECADIDNALAEFFSVTPSDPLMPGSMNNTDPAPNQFFYFYSPSYSCNGQTNPTLHVMNTETNIAVYNFNPCANQPSGPAGSPEQADYLQIIFTS